jgi:hypothetical protein
MSAYEAIYTAATEAIPQYVAARQVNAQHPRALDVYTWCDFAVEVEARIETRGNLWSILVSLANFGQIAAVFMDIDGHTPHIQIDATAVAHINEVVTAIAVTLNPISLRQAA